VRANESLTEMLSERLTETSLMALTESVTEIESEPDRLYWVEARLLSVTETVSLGAR
jgi:hypothetical protein